jgi:hypothetical protein
MFRNLKSKQRTGYEEPKNGFTIWKGGNPYAQESYMIMEKSYIIHTFNPKTNGRFETIFFKIQQWKNNTRKVGMFNSYRHSREKKVLRTGHKNTEYFDDGDH